MTHIFPNKVRETISFKNNATITTLRNNYLKMNHLSVVIRAFLLPRYYHLLPQRGKKCVFSAKNMVVT
jgi:hypothetical protein